MILIEDLTDLHMLEGELAHSERLASIGRLAAGVAHEIGNPVTGIACIAQNLKSESHDEDTLEATRAIMHETHRITDIVQSLVSFSHGGSLSLGSFDEVRLHDCVEEAIRLVRLSRAAKEAELVNRCDPALVVQADRPRVVQVLVNLLTNAIDASPPRSQVAVTGEALERYAMLRVQDHGEGIESSVMEKIFEPFVTTKPPGRGTGLGLSVVYRIVQDHGGSISIESEPGHGATVSVTLPRVAQPACDALPAKAAT